MANLRDIRNRIKSVKSTEKITRAMKMVAAAKLRRAQQAAMGATPYQKKIDAMLKALSTILAEMEHPLLKTTKVEKQVLIVISSDRGLCGGFNNNLFKHVHAFLKTSAVETELVLVGKKAIAHFGNKDVAISRQVLDFWPSFDHSLARDVFDEVKLKFLRQEIQQVHLAYNVFQNVMSQEPSIKKLLPMVQTNDEPADAKSLSPTDSSSNTEVGDPVFKPSKEKILQELLPKAVMSTFYSACLHSLAGEYGARMTSMDSASRNAGEMIDQLTLKMNRVRQAAITNELVEIISGAEAIK